ncbi:MAG: alpha/beta fold hydrolase [Chitinophagales bacterium]|nr:alpha/beta fold hydrolase [Chitinophagales bacterium]
MPILNSNLFKPSILFRSGYVSTIFPYFLRKRTEYPYVRHRVQTPDHDFFDIDWLKNPRHTKVAILLHGLEGGSNSQYINGLTGVLFQAGFDIAAVNFRSCSGEINLSPEMYHSGYTKDLEFILEHEVNHYDQIAICGFSLGGNVALKYAGQAGAFIHPKVKAVVGVSVPCDLRGVSLQFKKWYNYPYERLFLKTLMDKMVIKHQMHPEIIDIGWAPKIKNLWDFDEHFNAAMHDFSGAEDYYQQNSSIQFLTNIQIPALIINALDDTFLSRECYPYDAAEENPNLFLIASKYGGHVGFADFKKTPYWSESTIAAFLNEHTN